MTNSMTNNNLNNNNVAVRNKAENLGYKNIKWDGNNNGFTGTNVNGKTYFFDASGLENRNGTLYGTDEQVKNVFDKPLVQVRDTAVSQGVNVGYDGNSPILNGQSVSTNGMVLSDGNYYTSKDRLNSLISGVKPKEYVDPYKDEINTLIKELINYKNFEYDPENDEDLQKAMGFAKRQAMRDAVNRGKGNSFGMEYAAETAANNLIPQFRQQAREDYNTDRNYLATLLGYTNELSANALNEYNITNTLGLDNKKYASEQEWSAKNHNLQENELNEVKRQFDQSQEIERERLSLEQEKVLMDWANHKLQDMKYWSDEDKAKTENAIRMFASIGYATPEIAEILGIPEGTRTAEFTNNLILNGGLSASYATVPSSLNPEEDLVSQLYNLNGSLTNGTEIPQLPLGFGNANSHYRNSNPIQSGVENTQSSKINKSTVNNNKNSNKSSSTSSKSNVNSGSGGFQLYGDIKI